MDNSKMKITSVNPTTGNILKIYDELTSWDVSSKIEEAFKASKLWKSKAFSQRSALMMKAGQVLNTQKESLATLMAVEMGKPLKQGLAEVEKCMSVCKYYAEQAELLLANDVIKTEAQKSYVAFEPLGVVLAVMPWNFPLWQVFRFAAPTLMAGNVGLLKHASNVPGCALAISDIFREAGFPIGVFTTLLISNKQVQSVIENPMVSAITLTGSTVAGEAVASQAGRVLKKTVLELGGSDAYLVLEDADLDLAASACVDSRLINSGQSCIAAKRFIVVDTILEPFTEKFVALMKSKKTGDPLIEQNHVGPQARRDLRDQLHKQVLASVKQGASLILGGQTPPEDKSSFYPPTVLSNVKPGMTAFEEEIFGPVAAIVSATDENEAVRMANSSIYGLGSAIFSRDIERAENIASRLQAGSSFVNSLVFSDPRLPFGGIKNSGYGRELGSYGIKEFVNVKTVYIK